MKKLFFIVALVFISTLHFYAATLDGTLGLKFGMNQEDAKQVMLSRADFPINNNNKSLDALMFGAGKFAGRDIKSMLLKFVDNKLCTIAFFYSIDLESKVVNTYNEIKGELNQKYYTSDLDYENYSTPYEKGDGYTESAIKIGKAIFLTRWNFDSSPNSSVNNSITLYITDKLDVLLMYQDGGLEKIESDRNNENALKDY